MSFICGLCGSAIYTVSAEHLLDIGHNKCLTCLPETGYGETGFYGYGTILPEFDDLTNVDLTDYLGISSSLN